MGRPIAFSSLRFRLNGKFLSMQKPNVSIAAELAQLAANCARSEVRWARASGLPLPSCRSVGRPASNRREFTRKDTARAGSLRRRPQCLAQRPQSGAAGAVGAPPCASSAAWHTNGRASCTTRAERAERESGRNMGSARVRPLALLRRARSVGH